jgi:hypothetical protein
VFEMGNCWGKAKGDGEEEGGGQYTVNQGPEWTGIAPQRKGGIPSKYEGNSWTGAGISKQGGSQKDWVMHSESY